MRESIVLIHGIWLTGWEMIVLRKRLEREGFDCHQFSYSSILETPAENAARLNDFLRTIDAEIVHLLAYSLGGLVTMHLFDRFPMQKPGRVLLLGSPIKGSAVAHFLHRKPILRALLGKSVDQGLLGDAPRWKQTRELGMIAGSGGKGIGKLFLGRAIDPGDGTVALEETRSPDINTHLTAPYTHTSIIFAAPVAEAAANFFRSGDFE